MSDFKVNIDISGLTQYLENFAKEVTKDIQKGIKGLAISTQNHIKEEAQNKLHTFREEYLKNLSPPEQINDYLWVITLDSDANWIEEGRPEAYDMKPGLLNTTRPGAKPAKTSAGGKKYRIVPMNQAKAPSEMTVKKGAYEKAMVATVKSELKKRDIPYKKLEIDPKTGSPRIGKLHSFDIESNVPGKGNTPQLHGLSIYQTKQKDGSVKRQITTFRTVTEDQAGKWIHPPVEAKNFFKDAKTWAENEWEKTWLPQIMQKYSGR